MPNQTKHQPLLKLHNLLDMYPKQQTLQAPLTRLAKRTITQVCKSEFGSIRLVTATVAFSNASNLGFVDVLLDAEPGKASNNDRSRGIGGPQATNNVGAPVSLKMTRQEDEQPNQTHPASTCWPWCCQKHNNNNNNNNNNSQPDGDTDKEPPALIRNGRKHQGQCALCTRNANGKCVPLGSGLCSACHRLEKSCFRACWTVFDYCCLCECCTPKNRRRKGKDTNDDDCTCFCEVEYDGDEVGSVGSQLTTGSDCCCCFTTCVNGCANVCQGLTAAFQSCTYADICPCNIVCRDNAGYADQGSGVDSSCSCDCSASCFPDPSSCCPDGGCIDPSCLCGLLCDDDF